jgi:hypothetical protein
MNIINNTLNKILYTKNLKRSGGKMIGRQRLHQDTYFGHKGDVIDIYADSVDKNVWFENRGSKLSHKHPMPSGKLTQPLIYNKFPFVFSQEGPKGYYKEEPNNKHYTRRAKGGKKCIR